MEISISRSAGSSMTTIKRIIDHLEDANLIQREDMDRVKVDILFRFGGVRTQRSSFEINTPTMIRTINNKPLTRRLLDTGHVVIPPTYFNKAEIEQTNHIHFPLIGRAKYHLQGKGVIISNNIRDIRLDIKSRYWSEIIDKDREYRVYVFFGKVIGVEEKIPKDKNNIVWNFHAGNSVFKPIKRENYPIPVCTLAIQAAETIKIDFSAIDIISKGNQDYVLELNASPSCSGIRCKYIAKGLAWVRDKIETNHEMPRHFTLPNTIRSYRELVHPCI